MTTAPFANEPLTDFTVPSNRQAFEEALARREARLGSTYPLIIGGERVTTAQWIESRDPSRHGQLVGRAAKAGATEADRAIEAAQKAICSPLLEEGSVEGARGVLLNITGGPNMSLHEIEEAASIIQQAADAEANIIVGQVINPDMGDDLVVTVIATGFERDDQPAPVGVAAPRAVRAAQQALNGVGAVVADRPRKDLDRPTYLRRMGEQRESMERLAVIADDEWDVPTFLRKQTD